MHLIRAKTEGLPSLFPAGVWFARLGPRSHGTPRAIHAHMNPAGLGERHSGSSPRSSSTGNLHPGAPTQTAPRPVRVREHVGPYRSCTAPAPVLGRATSNSWRNCPPAQEYLEPRKQINRRRLHHNQSTYHKTPRLSTVTPGAGTPVRPTRP